MLMQNSQIPQLLVPWLALVLILLCLWVLIQVTWDMKKHGITKMHVRIFIPTLATILMLGFGSSVLGSVMTVVRTAQDAATAADQKAEDAQRAGDFLRSIVESLGSFADQGALTRSMSLAQSEEDRLLAFRMSAQSNPLLAKAWIANPENRALFTKPADAEALEGELELYIIAQQGQLPTNLRDAIKEVLEEEIRS